MGVGRLPTRAALVLLFPSSAWAPRTAAKTDGSGKMAAAILVAPLLLGLSPPHPDLTPDNGVAAPTKNLSRSFR